uniref:Uncharacterized protein n=1 Tax=Anguilla anguilla TaxID=7936 RepID=A0A0E9SRN4_ANGAN
MLILPVMLIGSNLVPSYNWVLHINFY